MQALYTASIASHLCFVTLAFIALMVVKLAFQPAQDTCAKSLMIMLYLSFGVLLVNLILTLPGYAEQLPELTFSTTGLVYGIAPILYLYIRRVTQGHHPFTQRYWYLHILPILATVIYFVPYALSSTEQKLIFINLDSAKQTMAWLYLGLYLQVITYLGYGYPYLRQYHRKIRQHYSDIEKINLRWLSGLCGCLLVLCLFSLLLPHPEVFSNERNLILVVLSALTITVLTVCALSYNRFEFLLIQTQRVATEPQSEESTKYRSSGLRDDTALYYVDKLTELMTSQHQFTQNDISLNSLARQVKISSHHLSQILNQQLNKSFYDYINEQRITLAKKLLLDENDQPIVDIALQVGYNNKVTFYKAFKKYQNITPANYRQQQLISARG